MDSKGYQKDNPSKLLSPIVSYPPTIRLTSVCLSFPIASFCNLFVVHSVQFICLSLSDSFPKNSKNKSAGLCQNIPSKDSVLRFLVCLLCE